MSLRRQVYPALSLALLISGCSSCFGPRPDSKPRPLPSTEAKLPQQLERESEDLTPTLPTPPPRPIEEMGPEDALEAWIVAQEQGDFAWAMSYLVRSAHEDWKRLAEEMSPDDLISSALRTRDEDYKVQYEDSTLAVFYSEAAQLNLVLVRENDRWKIDPHKTDQMNLQAPPEE